MARSIKREWATALADIGVRAVTISDATGLSDTSARELFRDRQQGKPPSGQTPTDPIWYTRTRERSFHAAFFLSLYQAARPHFSTRGLAFCHAFQTYWLAVGSPDQSMGSKLPLDSERANLLCKRFEDKKEGYKPPIRVCKCRKCGTLFLGLRDKVEGNCSFCDSK